jgi:multidrug resistance efflux pump
LLNYPEAVLGFQRVLHWETAVCAWLALAMVIALHESAHGLTCKRYGGEVREIGFLLIYFQPAFYCNVSEAWFFPEKSKRMWVTFAGAYCELFIWSLATLIWRLTEPSSTINYLALVVMITTGITSLFNLNPLIKLDGYYLLCDYLEIPSLRPRAFRYLAARLKWWRRPTDPILSAVPARERRFFWAYGLVAWIYSLGLLGAVVVSFASFLTQRYQGWGFVLFSALLAYAFRNPLQRALQIFAFASHGDNVMMHLIKRMKKLLKIAAVVAAVCALLFFVRAELRISGEFKLLPIHNAEVRAEVEGILEEIPRDEGETVKAGELIARLSDRDYRAEVRKIKAEIEEKEAKLKMFKAGPRAEAVELARTTVAKGEERLKYANTYLTMEKNLFADKLSSRKDFEVAEEMVSVREKELEEARGNLNVILAGSRPEEIEAIQAEINRLSAQQNYLEDELRLLRVVSPITGVITTHKLKEKIGGNVRKGDVIAVVHDMNIVTAEISVPERDISEVKLGQRVLLRARAFPQSGFEGKVTLIAPIATRPSESLGERMVLVVTQLENADLLLKPEMSGNAKIYCGKRRLLELMTRRLARFIRVEFWSWW